MGLALTIPSSLRLALTHHEIAKVYADIEEALSQNLIEYSTERALDRFWDLSVLIHITLEKELEEGALTRTTEELTLYFERNHFDSKVQTLFSECKISSLPFDQEDIGEAAYGICMSGSESPFLVFQATPYRPERYLTNLEELERDHKNTCTETPENMWAGLHTSDRDRLRDFDPGLIDEVLDAFWDPPDFPRSPNRKRRNSTRSRKVSADDMWEDYMRTKSPLQRLRILKRMRDLV